MPLHVSQPLLVIYLYSFERKNSTLTIQKCFGFLDHTSVSRQGRNRRRNRRRPRLPPLSSRASSFSSITDSTMSLNIITVTLNMDTVNFLGISIVGQSHQGGDGGIYVGSIMKGYEQIL